MLDHSQPEREPQDQCQHCWMPVAKGWLRFNGKIFCSLNCFRQYYGCMIRLFLIARGKRLKVFMLRKKSWSAGLLAGSIISTPLSARLPSLVIGLARCRSTDLPVCLQEASGSQGPYPFRESSLRSFCRANELPRHTPRRGAWI